MTNNFTCTLLDVSATLSFQVANNCPLTYFCVCPSICTLLDEQYVTNIDSCFVFRKASHHYK